MSFYDHFTKDPAPDSAPTPAETFTPAGPRQPSRGILWDPSGWASAGVDEWPLDARCLVCGGDLKAFDHARCWPSLDHWSPTFVSLAWLKRQLDGMIDTNPSELVRAAERNEIRCGSRNSGNSGNSAETETDAARLVRIADDLLAFIPIGGFNLEGRVRIRKDADFLRSLAARVGQKVTP